MKAEFEYGERQKNGLEYVKGLGKRFLDNEYVKENSNLILYFQQMAQATQSEGAQVANTGVEGINGTTCGLSVDIDGLGGTVDGVGGKVNDADDQFLHVLGCRGLDYGVWEQ